MTEEIKSKNTEEIFEADTETDFLDNADDVPNESEEVDNTVNEQELPPTTDEVDYEAIIESDLEILREEFSELKKISDITDLDNPLRYAALRDLGLNPVEAYMASRKRTKHDNRSHLTAAYGKNAVSPVGTMSQRELSKAREIFHDLSDSEIQRLYRKVTAG